MLVLSFEWINILQPALCVILFHAFESNVIFKKKCHFTGRMAGLALWTDFPHDAVSGCSFQTSRTTVNFDVQGLNFTANQKKERSFVRYMNFLCAVYESSVMAVSTSGLICFSNILLKLVVLKKSSPVGFFSVLLSTNACTTLVILLKNTMVWA